MLMPIIKVYYGIRENPTDCFLLKSQLDNDFLSSLKDIRKASIYKIYMLFFNSFLS
jgi:hypothetical protein